ncbi:hypothetical protein EV699_10978 [Plasticicumulans lactativorans]|uniref:Uncharacterized protein n=1 Tax=Plasticicumulans lactativorans TaxID=1133106 RepID=A0A4R2L474_9GAMM|nr:hypothetical protein [Plasticicumulans lactativorans]TCO81236.1 hypothetical protein EV699_10978 [Plasticicumulans lactativorans]
MLTEQECIDLCELSEEEIRAIAEHEHVPEVVAAELGQCLVQTHAGQWLIKRYIMEDIEQAQAAGRTEKAQQLEGVLERFDATHPTYNLRPAKAVRPKRLPQAMRRY